MRHAAIFSMSTAQLRIALARPVSLFLARTQPRERCLPGLNPSQATFGGDFGGFWGVLGTIYPVPELSPTPLV